MKPYYHKARKRFGQNFLQDESIIQRIIQSIQPKADDSIIEIGPGLGALTRPLLLQSKKIRVIELDRDIIPKLKILCFGDGELDIIQADALTVNFSELAMDGKKLRIIGNLPYNISTPLLFHLFQSLIVIQDMHFMLQKEVVERLTASCGGKSYGRLSIMAQYFCHTEYLFTVEPAAFKPAPKVDSAIIRLTPIEPENRLNTDVTLLNKIVTQAFQMRRKTIRNSLKPFFHESELIQLQIDPQARAETLSIETFVQLTDYLLSKDTS